MTRSEKTATIEELKVKFEENSFFYVTDSSTLTVEQVNKLRGLCFAKGVEMRVVKNTLVQKALEAAPAEKNYAGLYESLKGPTAIMFTDTAKHPASIIKEFRADGEDIERPLLKAAYIDSSIYIGDDKIAELSKLKSKDELVAEIIALLQSPAKNVISALNSGGTIISGLLKALEQRGE